MTPESQQPKQHNDQSHELISGVPSEIGGEAVRAAVEADIAASEAARAENPVIGVHTNLNSGRVQGHSYLTDLPRPPAET